jgi:hypothetical protein
MKNTNLWRRRNDTFTAILKVENLIKDQNGLLVIVDEFVFRMLCMGGHIIFTMLIMVSV